MAANTPSFSCPLFIVAGSQIIFDFAHCEIPSHFPLILLLKILKIGKLEKNRKFKKLRKIQNLFQTIGLNSNEHSKARAKASFTKTGILFSFIRNSYKYWYFCNNVYWLDAMQCSLRKKMEKRVGMSLRKRTGKR